MSQSYMDPLIEAEILKHRGKLIELVELAQRSFKAGGFESAKVYLAQAQQELAWITSFQDVLVTQ